MSNWPLKENDLVNYEQTVQLILLGFRQLDYTNLILFNSSHNPLMQGSLCLLIGLTWKSSLERLNNLRLESQ